jgi:hypothetical protein
MECADLTAEGAAAVAGPSDHLDARTEPGQAIPRDACPWCAGSNKPAFWEPQLVETLELSSAHHRTHGSDVY